MKTDENEKKHVSRALTLFLLIILSLLIHVFFFGTFLKYGFKNKAKKLFAQISNYLTPAQKQEIQTRSEKKHEAIKRLFQTSPEKKREKAFLFKKQADTRPAKLVAPKSNFGWVIFDEQHQQPDKLEIPNTKKGDVGVSQNSHATEVKPEEAKNLGAKQEPKPLAKSEIKTEKKLEEKPELQVKKISEIRPEIKEDLTAAKLGSVSMVKTEDVQKRIEEITKFQEKIEKLTDAAQKVESEVPQEQPREMTKEEEKNMILSHMLRKDNKASEQESPGSNFVWGAGGKKRDEKNLIKLTRGYIEKFRGESGTDLIDRDGDPNKKPSFEELKYISYESKINWCLQSSWKNNFSQNQAFPALESKAVIEFTVDESGKVISSSMLQSTGYREIDNAILKNLEFASPFPPIPKHFGTKTYTTGRSITVYAHRFGL